MTSPATATYWDAAPAERTGHVTVIGAGIIGLTSAAALVRSGRTVTVLDAHTEVGQGASLANGCQLSYAYVAPLAQPGVLAELPQLLLSRHAPLKIVPRWDPAQWRWLLSFLAACRSRRAREGSLALLALASLSRAETDAWLRDADHASLGFSDHGKLVVMPSEHAMAQARRQMALQAPFGPLQHAVGVDACLDLEPALHGLRHRMAGAIYTPSDCAIDSAALCRDLEMRLRARGVQFELGTQVTGFARRADRIVRLETSRGHRDVESVVLATGARSAAVTRQLGFRVPVYPLKGYSLTVPLRDPTAVPRVSVTDAARKLVYARIGGHLRVAGMAEIRGHDHQLDAHRVATLAAQTREAFGDAVDLDNATPWTGLRPATPSSVPIIRQSPVRNLFLNIGHGALGLTLAFGAARRLVDALDAALAPTQGRPCLNPAITTS